MADEGPKPKKRQVKDPETFRERALKASEAEDAARTKSKRRRPRTRKAAGSLAGAVAPPLKRIGRTKPARSIGKVVFPAYFRNSLRELKMVTWPNWKKSRQLTFAVLVFAIIFAALISVVDYGLNKVFKSILLN
ncbi:MAG TPA: preprotein translocase subunit SecE [Candidatus Saccharimonadales bacterium]|nr:preprotein translocase subunit SecE [Candidatus Saccharimonadales bacterium]